MPTMTRIADMAADGCLVKPLWHQFILDPEASCSLNLLVERPMPRQADGWFHASQHPLASPRELYLWATGQAQPEMMDYTGKCSVMFGSLMHAVFEAFLDWMGKALPLPDGDCPACGRPRRPLRSRPGAKYCTEHGAVHPATRARCHLDSILDLESGMFGFDLKTINIFAFGKTKDRPAVRDMDAAQFRERWPHYWAQMQECMRLTGLRRYIVFFLTMGMPWDTREFHIPFDPEFAAATEAKYLQVLSHVDRGVPILV
jgi:hypothetical protein